MAALPAEARKHVQDEQLAPCFYSRQCRASILFGEATPIYPAHGLLAEANFLALFEVVTLV